MPESFHNSEVDPQTALETIRRLAPHGFGDAEFELVHHWGANGGLTHFKRHCNLLIERKGQFRPSDNNHLLHLRLLLMLKRCNDHPTGRKDFKSLAAEAMMAHPPLEKNAK